MSILKHVIVDFFYIVIHTWNSTEPYMKSQCEKTVFKKEDYPHTYGAC